MFFWSEVCISPTEHRPRFGQCNGMRISTISLETGLQRINNKCYFQIPIFKISIYINKKKKKKNAVYPK